MVWETSISDSVQHALVHVGKWDYARGPRMVSDILGLLWRAVEDGWCIVWHTCLACLTDLRDSPFYCTSLTAGRYSSIALNINTLFHFWAAQQCCPGGPEPLN